jgi:tetratricopeptide (TPR) repeat protein
MKKYLFLIVCFLLLISCMGNVNYGNDIPINERPMYGGIKKTEGQKEADEKFIKNMVEDCGSKEAAAKDAIEKAWKYYYENDFSTSMKRFNQAWLLDSTNYQIYWGFGLLLTKQENFEKAISYLEKALKIEPQDEAVLHDLDFAYAQYGSTQWNLFDRVEYLNKSIEIYKQVEAINDANGLLYNNWAVSLADLGKHEEAWEKLQKAISLGYEVDPRFISELKKRLK